MASEEDREAVRRIEPATLDWVTKLTPRELRTVLDMYHHFPGVAEEPTPEDAREAGEKEQ